jgi:serine/threonine protein kinase
MSLAQKRFARDLIGRRVSGWMIKEVINSGKSAVVFLGQKKGQLAAVKVFDPDLIDRFGKDVQAERVERERHLIGRHHPNLIKILDGGYDKAKALFFVVMERFAGPNLAECLVKVPREGTRLILAQVASAAEYLETLGLAHRDIKPSNIGLSDDMKHAVLMDLGVIKPVGIANFTDVEGKRFVGILQYASPEFLFRMEEDTPTGWRATTFYQLGAVLHDLLVKRPLFNELVEPFACLVEAVKERNPAIDAPDAPPELVELARHCLVKSPQLRLQLVTWESFAAPTGAKPEIHLLRERIRKRTLLPRGNKPVRGATTGGAPTILKQRFAELSQDLCVSGGVFPPAELLDTGPDATSFCLRFVPSERFKLAVHLLISFHLEMEDTVILRIDALACASGSILAPEQLEPPKYSRIYLGSSTSGKVGTAIQEFLYFAFNEAQERSIKAGEIQYIPKPAMKEKSA